MSSALTLIVFGQVCSLSSGTNTPFITPNSTRTPIICQPPIQPKPTRGLTRSDYKVHSNATTWNEALKICALEGGHLVIINSVAESQHISELARKADRRSNTNWPDYFHVGSHNLFNSSEWVTIHSEPLEEAGFNEWDRGQPGRVNYDACAAIHSVTGKLDYSGCLTPLGFICELPNV